MKGITFTARMIDAILAGAKTETRRVSLGDRRVGERLWIKRGRFGRRVDSPCEIEITGIVKMPLRAIGYNGALLEGFAGEEDFRKYWDKLHKPPLQWNDNPDVFVVMFRRIK